MKRPPPQMPRPPRIPGFELLAISDRRALGGGAFEPWLERLGAAGVGAVQIREKDLSDGEILGLGRSARRLLPPKTTLLINGRVDLARGVESEGARSVFICPPTACRSVLCASASARTSRSAVPPILRTRWRGRATRAPITPRSVPSTRRRASGVRTASRAWVARTGCRPGTLPHALGGVTLERLPELAAAGAAGIAGIRIFLEPTDLAELVATARALFGPHSPASSRPAP